MLASAVLKYTINSKSRNDTTPTVDGKSSARCTTGPDRRHLETPHTQLDANDGSKIVIEPCTTRQETLGTAAAVLSATHLVLDLPTQGHAVVSQRKTKMAPRRPKKKATNTSVKEDAACMRSIHGNAETEEEYPLQESSPDEELVETVTSNSGHNKWKNFEQNLAVDQATAPILETSHKSGCGISCAFGKSDTKDCPFHHPYPSDVNPLQDLCWLVYPRREIFSSGPYTRARAERMLSSFQQDQRTVDRMLLLDDELVSYLLGDHYEDAHNQPHNREEVQKKMAMEEANLLKGCNPGRLMKQEREFFRLMRKNMHDHQVSPIAFQNLQLELMVKGSWYICYCRMQWSGDENPDDFIECGHGYCEYMWFHRACIKEGSDKVTQWYCNVCDAEMRVLAHDTLLGVESTDD